jgi:5-methylcytosine-specific restriction endonuclease McrA
MERALQELVWERAGRCCEYCRMPQEFDEATFEIDHVVALSHGGPTRASNLCLACFSCNSFKGPNLSGIDPKTKKIVPLFNPRRHS